jgi:calcineurin-like phosphoesterase family protein
MSELYIAADVNFFNTEAAEELELNSVGDYNLGIIKQWNSIVKPEDTTLLLGNISNGSMAATKEVFSQLNGIKKIISYEEGNPFTKEEWQSIGVSSICNICGYINGNIENEDKKVIITTTKNLLKFFKDYYCAAPGSFLTHEEIFKDRILNISINNWGYMPIKYKDLPQIIDNQILFNKMENGELLEGF